MTKRRFYDIRLIYFCLILSTTNIFSSKIKSKTALGFQNLSGFPETKAKVSTLFFFFHVFAAFAKANNYEEAVRDNVVEMRESIQMQELSYFPKHEEIHLQLQYKIIEKNYFECTASENSFDLEHPDTQTNWQVLNNFVIRFTKSKNLMNDHESNFRQNSILTNTNAKWMVFIEQNKGYDTEKRKISFINKIKSISSSVFNENRGILSYRVVSVNTDESVTDNVFIDLQTSIPINHMKNIDKSVIVLTLHMSPNSVPYALSFKKTTNDKLKLILDNFVDCKYSPHALPVIFPLPKPRNNTIKIQEQQPSFLAKYWWMFLLVLLGISLFTAEPRPAQNEASNTE